MPKIALLTRYDTMGASSRVRSLQYLPIFEAAGLQMEHFPLLSNEYVRRLYAGERSKALQFRMLWKRICAMPSIADPKRFDLLWIEKELLPYLPYGLERWLLGSKVPFVLDFDDAIFHNYDCASNPAIRMLMGDKIDRLMARSSLVICGNGYLADRARRAGAPWVEILPSTIDFEKYRPLPPPVQDEISADNPLRIIWIGSPHTVQYLELARPALAQLQERYPLELRVIGSERNWPEIKTISIPWSGDTEAAELNKAHVGIMPLLNTPWEQGKCGFKLIQYMAAGLPVIGSDVGMNKDIVQVGENGLLTDGRQDWIDSLEKLAESPELRARMGAVGRRLAEERYSIQAVGPKLAALLAEAAAAPR